MEYISIKQIMDDILINPLLKDLPFDRAVNYAVEFIRIMGMPKSFIDKVADIDIENHRGALPCDFIYMNQVRGIYGPVYTASQSSFEDHGFSYKIQGNIIYTSTKNCPIQISYTAMHLDNEGFPMIIDNSSFIRALEFYIKKRWYTILFDSSKISAAVLQNTQQEYSFYAGQAQSELTLPSIDEMESIKNMWCTLIQKNDKHSSYFADTHRPEILKI